MFRNTLMPTARKVVVSFLIVAAAFFGAGAYEVSVAAQPAQAQTADYIKNSPNSDANLYVNTGVTLKPGQFVQARQYYIPGGWCATVSLYRDGNYTGETYRVGKGWHYGYTDMTTQVRRYLC